LTVFMSCVALSTKSHVDEGMLTSYVVVCCIIEKIICILSK